MHCHLNKIGRQIRASMKWSLNSNNNNNIINQQQQKTSFAQERFWSKARNGIKLRILKNFFAILFVFVGIGPMPLNPLNKRGGCIIVGLILWQKQRPMNCKIFFTYLGQTSKVSLVTNLDSRDWLFLVTPGRMFLLWSIEPCALCEF